MAFAQEHLGPRAPENKEYLDAMEKTMCLVMIPHDKLDPQLASLLDSRERQEAAELVNVAMLKSRSARTIASLRKLTKTRAWAEARAKELNLPVPGRIDIGLHGEESQSTPTRQWGENGNDDTVMT